jgi:capsid protein
MTDDIFRSSSGSTYRAAGSDRLLSDWNAWLVHPDNEWATDAQTLAVRAWDLFRNDPVARAMIQTELILTHGSEGLRYHSLYRDDDNDETSEAEHEVRSQADTVVNRTWEGVGIDAGGLLSRVELEWAIDCVGRVGGDGFGVRCWKPSRIHARFATCWRLVRGEFVTNPGYAPDTQQFFRGIEFDGDNQPVAIHVQHTVREGVTYMAPQWTRIPFWGEDGTPNVIFRVGDRMPGAIRGLSIFAPALTAMRHVAGTNEAFVVGKRTQASHPIIKKVPDPAAAAAADAAQNPRGNTGVRPLSFIYTSTDSDIEFPSWSFNGADMRDFLDGQYRSICAARGLPWEFVLAQLTDANLAASRAAMLQAYRTAARWQNEQIIQCTSKMDQGAVREGIGRGEVDATAEDPARFMASHYRRPPRAMPDPKKEAEAGETWADMGRDFTGIFAESGLDFEQCVRQRAADDRFLKAQAVTLNALRHPRYRTAEGESKPEENPKSKP